MIAIEKRNNAVSAWRIALFETWGEFRFGIKSSLIPVIFFSLTLYLLMVLCQADSLRQLGASDVPRNAPALVYMMTSGDVFFLLFAWAWVFAQPVVRDRRVHLAELVLTTPVSLRALLFGRFLGATGIAIILGASQAAGFVLAPLLEIVGLVPAGTMGPPPWGALAWAWLIFTLPSCIGFGAIYLAAGIKTRSLIGPFAAAALIMAIWMIAIVGLKDAGYARVWTTLLDPSGYAEAESQALDWTPHEKATSFLALTFPLLLNRFVWCLLPLGYLVWIIVHVTREQLASEVAGERRTKPSKRLLFPIETTSFPVPARPSWARGLASESKWQCRLVLTNKAVIGGFCGLVLIGVAGGVSHVMGSADGPLVPYPEVVAPLMTKMMSLMIAFVAGAATGIIIRRDAVPGFDNMLDITSAPYAVRFYGKIVAVFVMTVLLTIIPAFATVIITLIGTFEIGNPGFPFIYQTMVSLPALLEMTAAFMFVHLLVRNTGLAYSLSMLLAFTFILNREAHLISYPPAKIGIPAAIAYSSLTGWKAWADYLALTDLWKIGLVTFTVSLGGLMTYKPVVQQGNRVWGRIWRRLYSQFGAAVAVSLIGLVLLTPFLRKLLVTEGRYHSFSSELVQRALWERRWASRVSAFHLGGGTLTLAIDPKSRSVHGHWEIEGLQTDGALLTLMVPAGLLNLNARIDDRDVSVELANEQAGIPTDSCTSHTCRLNLSWTMRTPRWNTDGTPPRIVGDKMWLTAEDVAPVLGVTPDRLIVASKERRKLGLPSTSPSFPAAAIATSQGIAPAGAWNWIVQFSGVTSTLTGHMAHSPFDFTIRSNATPEHDGSRAQTAKVLEVDIRAMSACLKHRLAIPMRDIVHIVQLPRAFPKTILSGNTLFLPESPDWDIADRGTGRLLRKASIAKAISRQIFEDITDIRRTPGSGWLTEGLAGSLGLLCVGDTDGLEALQRVLEHQSETVTLALAASAIPIGPAATALTEGWWSEYGPLALLGWAASREPQDYVTLLHTTRETGSIVDGLRASDPVNAARLLGMPRASDLHGSPSSEQDMEWIWKDGQWKPDNEHLQKIRLVKTESGIVPVGSQASSLGSFLWVDVGAYERIPSDNISRP